MKKMLLMSLCLVFLMGCGQTVNEDSIQTKETYTMSEYSGLKTSDIRFKTDTPDCIIKKLEDKVPGTFFIGFSDCPWCQSLVPVLNDVLIDKDQYAYYLDVRSSDFSSNQSFVERYNSFDEGLGKFGSGGSVPFLIVIDENGKVQTHIGTLENHDASKEDLNDEQVEQLKKILSDMIK